MNEVLVTGSFDNLRSSQVRFLDEASRLGPLHVLLDSDRAAALRDGRPPRFPQAERLYLLEALRFVSKVTVIDVIDHLDAFPPPSPAAERIWAVSSAGDTPQRRAICQSSGIQLEVISDKQLAGFPVRLPEVGQRDDQRKKVLVTGCYDWLHSGHVRFFEEAALLGDLYVVVGSDDNVRLLKGPGHPLFSQDERRYMVQAVRHVHSALISTGSGWMDAEPEIAQVKPDIYLVNEDGDKPEKREFCSQHGLEYVVLKRTPREGLPRRESTHLRGF